MLENIKRYSGIILLMLITAAVSIAVTTFVFIGWNYFNPQYELKFNPDNVDIKSLQKFNQVKEILEKNYYRNVNMDKLLEGAAAGMAYSLNDPYTVYFTREQLKMFKQDLKGSYIGIGVSVTMDKDGLVTIIEPFSDSPAKAAGIRQGDKIVKVDDKDVTGIKDETPIINMIQGKENTKVKLTVYRPSAGKALDFTITRKEIKIENLKGEVLQGNIGYIKIVKFDEKISVDFSNNLDKLLREGIKGLIIDVRDNPGGYYDEVVKISSRLIPKGKLIVYTEDRNKKQSKAYSKGDKGLGIPLVVLTNGNSASASEILTGTVKDNKAGTLVGTKTFGKGLVQVDYPLVDGSGIKVTIARYYTPSGICIQGIGIKPDIFVESAEKYLNVPASQIPRDEDIQLKSAIEAVKAKME